MTPLTRAEKAKLITHPATGLVAFHFAQIVALLSTMSDAEIETTAQFIAPHPDDGLLPLEHRAVMASVDMIRAMGECRSLARVAEETIQ